MSVTKKLDAKGRLVLGPEYANTIVLVDKNRDGEFIIKPATVVPVKEAWLFQNREALKLVEEGITQAKKGKLKKLPLNKEDVSWIDKLKD